MNVVNYMKEQKLWRNKPWIGASSDHKQWQMKQEGRGRSK